MGVDDIPLPQRPEFRQLMHGYLCLGARVCGEPAYNSDFGSGDFCVLLDKVVRRKPLYFSDWSVSAAAEMAGAKISGATQ